MLKWAKNHIRKQSYANKVEAKVDFRACMERLSRDLKLYKISPNDLIKEKSLVLTILTFILKFEYCPPIFLIVCKMETDNQYLLTLPLQTVLPSKAIKNERILETLMFQANSGMYRIHDSYLKACQEGLRHQDSKFSESFDCTL